MAVAGNLAESSRVAETTKQSYEVGSVKKKKKACEAETLNVYYLPRLSETYEAISHL